MRVKVLITGGCGFLGYNLASELVRRDYEVYVIDNLTTGNLNNIKHLEKLKNFQFHDFDVRSKKEYKVDGIFNLACPASPKQYQKDPIETLTTSVFGTLNMLEVAVDNGGRFLQASTSEIYGSPLSDPQNEDDWKQKRACF